MYYTLLFFDFQLQFARRLAARFDLPLPDALLYYTTFSKTLEQKRTKVTKERDDSDAGAAGQPNTCSYVA